MYCDFEMYFDKYIFTLRVFGKSKADKWRVEFMELGIRLTGYRLVSINPVQATNQSLQALMASPTAGKLFVLFQVLKWLLNKAYNSKG